MKVSFLKIKNQFFIPSNKYIRNFLHIIYFIKSLFTNKKTNKKSLLIWDIRCNSITFDFILVVFYVHNCLKNRQKETFFDLVIYYPKFFSVEPFNYKDYCEYVSSSELNARIQNIILPLAKSFNCINKIFFLKEESQLNQTIRQYSNVYPRNYDAKYFVIEPLDFLKAYKFLKKGNYKVPILTENLSENSNNNNEITKNFNFDYITFNLRDYGFSPTRNTNQSDIQIAIELARKLETKLVIVPDDFENLKKYSFNKDVIICRQARENISYRINLYSNSKLNIFKPCGPSFVSFFTKNTKTIILNFCEGGFDSNEKYYLKEYNLKVGEQPYIKLGAFLLWHQIYPNFSVEDIFYAYKKLNKTLI